MGFQIQRFLDEMYQKFIPILDENIPLNKLCKFDDKTEASLQNIVWRPVAIEVIVTVLDSSLALRTVTGRMLQQRISEIDFKKLASECGLTMSKALIAIGLAVDLLSEEENLTKLQNIFMEKQT